MKRSLLSLFSLLWFCAGWAQIITTTPTFITKDYTGEIQIVYDATQGTAGLKDYTGTVYAHTGVITTASTSSSDWKHAPTWGDNSAKYQLTSLGNNKWKLLITPSMASYYGLNTGEVVQKLAFVFRSGEKVSGSYLEGKDTGGSDIFATLYDTGLNVAFTNPTASEAVTAGTAVSFTVSSSLSANLALTMNGTTLTTQTSATTLTYSYTFANTGDYTLIASATLNGSTVYDTLKICVPEPVVTQARPAGTVLGINYIDDTSATLVFHAPGKTNVFLIGDFNDWSQLNAYQLKQDDEYWWITLTGLTPGKIYGYQYLVDGTLKVSDPYTEMVLDPWNDKWINQYYSIYPDLKAYPEGKTDGLVATLQTAKPEYTWEVPSFTMSDKENMVIYELLLRDFTPEKSLAAAINKLDYLKNLGITAVELMPVQEFDGNNSWGYNPSHYFAPDKAYGNEDMYKKFIDECHKRGIAVILDMVFNQASGLCPFATLYWDGINNRPAANNPWMNPVAPHPYSVLNDFNHSYSGTRDYFKRVLKYWLTEYKVDGYRMDLTKGFTQKQSVTDAEVSSYDQSRVDILTDYYNAAKEAKSDVMFILEHFCFATEENALANKGMYLWNNQNSAYSQAAMGHQSSSDFGSMITSPRNWVGYAESHDEYRNFYKVKTWGAGTLTTDSISRVERVPLTVAFATLLPGPKMVWQFEEMGYDYNTKNSDGSNDTSMKPSAWGYLNLAHRKAAADACAKIIMLRKMYPTAFTEGTFSTQVTYSDWLQGRRISLTHGDLDMIVLGNFLPSSTITASPAFQKTGTWYNVLTGATLDVTNTNMTITMQPGELLIYTDKAISFPSGLKNVKDESTQVFPSVTKDWLYISSDNTVKTVKVYNMQGSLVLQSQNVTEFNLGAKPNGLYIVEVATDAGVHVQKVVKQ